MTLAVLKSRALTGMTALEVTVEVHLANGLPAFTIARNNTPYFSLKLRRNLLKTTFGYSSLCYRI